MDNVIIGILTFLAGIFVGFFGRGLFDRQGKRGENTANTFVLVIVTLIWATSVLIDILSPTYETSPLIHGLMGAIVGFFFKPWQTNQEKDNSENNRRKDYNEERRKR